MKYEAGQTLTVMRGKTRGQSAEVIGVDSTNQSYAVKYVDGTFGVINAVNVKEPVEATIGAGKLAELVQATLDAHPAAEVTQLQDLLVRLNEAGLDTSSKVRVPNV